MAVPVISIAQMRDWEKATWSSGQTGSEVIRRVGRCVAERALRLTGTGDRILILAGKGHNGDDARSAGGHLGGRQVDLLEVRDPEKDLETLVELLARRPALVLDGLFGLGINRALSPSWIKFIRQLNAARVRVLAVDVPSGLNADTGQPEGEAVNACVTLTVGAPKRGLLEPAAWPYVGRLEVAADVGLAACPHESDVCWTLPEDFAGFPPPRPVADHKGSFGHVALVCGSLGYHGAAVLSARGAQRARPGLITLCVHEPAYVPVAAQLQSVMVQPWATKVALPEKCSAVLAGPGLAAADLPRELRELVSSLWTGADFPTVVDASALDWLPRGPVPAGKIRVVTPHPGEAARLLGTTPARVQADRRQSLRALSERLGGCWVVLKGHQTLVGRAGGPVHVNSSGNPWLAQGGAGDLLGGFLAGFLAQPALLGDVCQTIRYAVWQHGASADRLQEGRPGWTVEDLAGALG